ncbi:MAG TPA: SGNH/GDSL hydrolase family protein [Candidatus Elarobacter sp.]|jgi:lysophospholipase L1-like esterase
MMRRSALLGALGACTALGACASREGRGAPSSAHASGSPVVIVTLGDSLALGVGASAPRNGFIFRSFVRVLAERPGSRIESYAIGGATAADVLRLQVPRLAHARADAVVLCAGGNDVVHRVDPKTFAATYARLVARVRSLQPHAALVCCGVPDVGLSPLFTGADHEAVVRLSRQDDAAVRSVARSAGAAFADLGGATALDAMRYLADDRFHPSDAGYAAFAAVLTPVLRDALARRAPRAR